MKKISSFLALIIAGVCCIAAAYFCQFYYSLYKSSATALDGLHFSGLISTVDVAPDKYMPRTESLATKADNHYDAVNAKGGAVVVPEIRLPPISETNLEFDIYVENQFGVVSDVWLSRPEPYAEMDKFDWFRLSCPNGTNMVKLIARPKPGASIKMRFDFVVLCQK